jgi:hypothetical protein
VVLLEEVVDLQKQETQMVTDKVEMVLHQIGNQDQQKHMHQEVVELMPLVILQEMVQETLKWVMVVTVTVITVPVVMDQDQEMEQLY